MAIGSTKATKAFSIFNLIVNVLTLVVLFQVLRVVENLSDKLQAPSNDAQSTTIFVDTPPAQLNAPPAVTTAAMAFAIQPQKVVTPSTPSRDITVAPIPTTVDAKLPMPKVHPETTTKIASLVSPKSNPSTKIVARAKNAKAKTMNPTRRRLSDVRSDTADSPRFVHLSHLPKRVQKFITANRLEGFIRWSTSESRRAARYHSRPTPPRRQIQPVKSERIHIQAEVEQARERESIELYLWRDIEPSSQLPAM